MTAGPHTCKEQLQHPDITQRQLPAGPEKLMDSRAVHPREGPLYRSVPVSVALRTRHDGPRAQGPTGAGGEGVENQTAESRDHDLQRERGRESYKGNLERGSPNPVCL